MIGCRKIFKIITSILLIFALSNNLLAAIVSDNDGSAFVTNELSDYLIQENLWFYGQYKTFTFYLLCEFTLIILNSN